MARVRLLFEKMGRSKYLSHLDLMRTFQRVFIRAGVPLRHTEGFNPHPYLSFALPLSVGVESVTELLDAELGCSEDLMALPMRLNHQMPEGIRVLEAYEPATKFAALAWVAVEGYLDYDAGIPAIEVLSSIFASKELVITKKTKKGMAEVNIIPAIGDISFEDTGDGRVLLRAVIAAQNPSLNPEHLITAIKTHCPDLTPDFAAFKRLAVYDGAKAVFH
ncbi:TIGR03936 family radical SAM-associated protein [Oscillospiraceae bacterium WX1]